VSARDVIDGVLFGRGYDATEGTANAILAALDSAGYVILTPAQDASLTAEMVPGYAVVPVEMTPEQARRSLAGHALADRVRDANPAAYERMVAMRQATWRQMVKAMGGGDR